MLKWKSPANKVEELIKLLGDKIPHFWNCTCTQVGLNVLIHKPSVIGKTKLKENWIRDDDIEVNGINPDRLVQAAESLLGPAYTRSQYAR